MSVDEALTMMQDMHQGRFGATYFRSISMFSLVPLLLTAIMMPMPLVIASLGCMDLIRSSTS
jgi:hypothetical protein